MNYTEFKNKVSALDAEINSWISIEIEDDAVLRIYMKWSDDYPIAVNDSMSAIYDDNFGQIREFLGGRAYEAYEEEHALLDDEDAYFWCIAIENPDRLFYDYSDFFSLLETVLKDGVEYIEDNCVDEDDEFNEDPDDDLS